MADITGGILPRPLSVHARPPGLSIKDTIVQVVIAKVIDRQSRFYVKQSPSYECIFRFRRPHVELVTPTTPTSGHAVPVGWVNLARTEVIIENNCAASLGVVRGSI